MSRIFTEQPLSLRFRRDFEGAVDFELVESRCRGGVGVLSLELAFDFLVPVSDFCFPLLVSILETFSRAIGASDSLSLPPIKTSFSQDLQSQLSSAPSPQRSIVLPPLNLTHPPHIPSSQSQGSNHSFPSILTAPSSSSTFSSLNGNNGPLTPVLPSIRSQLPFSFNNTPSTSTSIPSQIAPSLALSNSRTQSFDRRIPLPPMKTSPSIL